MLKNPDLLREWSTKVTVYNTNNYRCYKILAHKIVGSLWDVTFAHLDFPPVLGSRICFFWCSCLLMETKNCTFSRRRTRKKLSVVYIRFIRVVVFSFLQTGNFAGCVKYRAYPLRTILQRWFHWLLFINFSFWMSSITFLMLVLKLVRARGKVKKLFQCNNRKYVGKATEKGLPRFMELRFKKTRSLSRFFLASHRNPWLTRDSPPKKSRAIVIRVRSGHTSYVSLRRIPHFYHRIIAHMLLARLR